MSFEFLERHYNKYKSNSTNQVYSYGTSTMKGKISYMPHYPLEKMSNQQVDDLRAYVEQRAKG